MTVMFRVEATTQSGLGHLMRCQALAQGFALAGEDCVFVINGDICDWCKRRHDWVGRVEALPDALSLQEEVDWLRQCALTLEVRVLVLDGYHFDETYRQAVASLPLLHVCFDDTATLPAFHADVVINPAFCEHSSAYQHSARNATMCLGEKYRVLRQEFVAPPAIPWKDRQILTIAMGGSDSGNLTLSVLEALEAKSFSGLIRVVTGVAYPHLVSLQAFLRRTILHVQHVHDCQHMAEVFCHSRLVISAAGGTQFELSACATPAQLIVVADNQIKATQLAGHQGWCKVYDALQSESFSAQVLVQDTMQLWQQDETLMDMSIRAENSAQRQGALNVVDAIGQRMKTSL